jgi:catechol 2,3-dioxygenase-like lactoylglutathione lyase family enzyme
MIDHIGFPVSDYERSKAFYEQALAPLGYALIMEVNQTENDAKAAGFGIGGKPDFWIGGEGGLNLIVHVAIEAKDRAAVDAFYQAALAVGGRDNGAPGIRAQYHPNYYAAFVFDPDGHNIEAVCNAPTHEDVLRTLGPDFDCGAGRRGIRDRAKLCPHAKRGPTPPPSRRQTTCSGVGSRHNIRGGTIVTAKTQAMPSKAYRLIWRAVRRRERLAFNYRDLPRECCPVVLGYAADGREAVLAYQYAGATNGKAKLPQWRCFSLADIRDLRSSPGPWYEGTSHTQPQSFVRFVDVDANIPETLTGRAPLPFGSPKLRPPRKG